MAEEKGISELMAEKVKISINPEPLKALEKQLNDLEKFIEKKNEIVARCCKKLEPLARRLVMQQLKKSGLERISGDLESWVSRSICYPTKKGIRIGPPQGLSQDAYKKMGALQFGYLRGTLVKNKKQRTKIKVAARVNAQLTNLFRERGAALVSAKGLVAGHDYYELDAGAVKQLEDAFRAHFQVEVNRALGLAK